MNGRPGVVSRLFGVKSESAAVTLPDEPLSGVALRMLANALRETPTPITLWDLRTNLNKVSERIGFGDRVFRQVRVLPDACVLGGIELNLGCLCRIAGVDPASLGVVVRTVTRSAAPTPAPPLPPPAAKVAVAQPTPATPQLTAKDGRSVIVTNEPRASAWRSLRVMQRILEEESNWPKGKGVPTWGYHAIVTWQLRFHSPQQTMSLMQKVGLVKCDTYHPISRGVYLWLPCDVTVVTRNGKDLPDMPEEVIRAELRYYLYHRGRVILSCFPKVKIPESPK